MSNCVEDVQGQIASVVSDIVRGSPKMIDWCDYDTAKAVAERLMREYRIEPRLKYTGRPILDIRNDINKAAHEWVAAVDHGRSSNALAMYARLAHFVAEEKAWDKFIAGGGIL